MERTIGEAFGRRRNNFDLLRLTAALLVIFSHSYPLTGSGPDPILPWSGGHFDGGALGVATFFVISGFLVTRSVEVNSIAAYASSRLLRILPALALVVVMQTFLLGSAFTNLPLFKYLASPETWDGLRNILVFDIRNTLPGVFTTNPLTAVNGSLWTLPVESSFYLLLPLLFLLGLLRRGTVVVVTLLLFAGFFAAVTFGGYSWTHHGGFVFWSTPFFPALNSLLYFLMGAVLWVHREEIPHSHGLAICCVIALFASARSLTATYALHIALPYLVIYVALARPVMTRALHRIGDISYGTYLFAFPVQQGIIASFGSDIGPLRLTALSTIITLCLAMLSWHFLEKRALRWKGRRVGTGQVGPPGVVASPPTAR